MFSLVTNASLIIRSEGVISTPKKTTAAVIKLLRGYSGLYRLNLENLDPNSAFDDDIYKGITGLNLRLKNLLIGTKHWHSSNLDLLISSLAGSLTGISINLVHGSLVSQETITSTLDKITDSVCNLKGLSKLLFEAGRSSGEMFRVDQYSKRVLHSIYEGSRDTITSIGVDIFPPQELDLFSGIIKTNLCALSICGTVDIPKLKSTVKGSQSLRTIRACFKPGDVKQEDVRWFYRSLPVLKRLTLCSAFRQDDPVEKYANERRIFMHKLFDKIILLLYPCYSTSFSVLRLLSVDIVRRIICDYLYK
jgi:hypothetical protein